MTFDWHVLRDRLLAEAHARPSTPIAAPALILRLANVSGQDGVAEDRARMFALAGIVGAAPPDATARWWAIETPGWSLRWERHTEFSSWTLVCPPPSAADPRRPLGRLPREWLAAFPAQVLVATMIEMRVGVGDLPSVSDGLIVGSQVLEGAATVITDFRADESGMTRYRVQLARDDAAVAGRLALLLLEIETYRLMALLAFPLAGEATETLRGIEVEAGTLAARLAAEEGVEADRTLLQRLVALSGEAEALSARTTFRFAAAQAYHELVLDRVMGLREEKLAGMQTLAEFMERRLAPAMRTCISVGERERAVIARIARAGAMLDTRIKVADEATSAALLMSMNRRAETSLRLQRTVEGLSVAAISYYALSLLAYPVKGLEHAFPAVDTALVLALLAPVVLIGVWLAVRRVRRGLDEVGE